MGAARLWRRYLTGKRKSIYRRQLHQLFFRHLGDARHGRQTHDTDRGVGQGGQHAAMYDLARTEPHGAALLAQLAPLLPEPSDSRRKEMEAAISENGGA